MWSYVITDSANPFLDLVYTIIFYHGRLNFLLKRVLIYLHKATLGAFALGNSIGWSSPASGRLQSNCTDVDFDVSSNDFAWVGSLLTVGAALSTFPAGFLVDSIGRKSTMFYISIPYIAGWIIITLANGVKT